MRRLAVLSLSLGIIGLVALNVYLYVELGNERTWAENDAPKVEPPSPVELDALDRAISDQIEYVLDQPMMLPSSEPPAIPAARDPFGIVQKKEDIKFPYKLRGIIGNVEQELVAMFSDGSAAVFAKAGEKIGETPFVVDTVALNGVTVKGPRSFTLIVGKE